MIQKIIFLYHKKIIINQEGLVMLLVVIILNIKVMEIKISHCQLKKYLNIIRSYLSDIINDYKTQGEWKIHLTMTMIFFFFKGF